MRLRLSAGAAQNGCVILVCIWALTPPLLYSLGARMLAVGAVAAWLFIEITKPRGLVRAPTLPVVVLAAFGLYTLPMGLLMGGTEGLIRSTQLSIMLFFLLVQQGARRRPESLHWVIWVILLLNLVWMTQSLLVVLGGEDRAMRTVVRASAEARELADEGVGGYAMVYAAVLMLPPLIALALRPDLITRLTPAPLLRVAPYLPVALIWYLTGLSVVLILAAQYSIAVLAATLSAGLTLLLWRLSGTRLLFALLLGLGGLLYGKQLLIELLYGLAPLADGTNYAMKIKDTLATLQGGDPVGAAAERTERYLRSLGLLLSNPVTGVLDFGLVGKHSAILDHLARWGLIMGGAFAYLVTFTQVRALRAAQGQPGLVGTALGALAAVLMVFGFNAGFASAGIVIFLFYPAVFRLLARETPLRAGRVRTSRGAPPARVPAQHPIRASAVAPTPHRYPADTARAATPCPPIGPGESASET